MTTTEDPWAAAAADAPEGKFDFSKVETSFDDEFGEETNPESAVGSALPIGTKLPGFPKINQLYNHLVIVEPLGYDAEAKTYAARMGQAGKQTEEQFRAKVVVLAGAPITVAEIEKQADGTWKKTGEKVQPEFPVAFYNMTINQGRLIGQLKKKYDIETGEKRDGGKWLGTLRRSANPTLPKQVKALPFPAQYDACDQLMADWQKAVAEGEEPEKPKFSPMIAASSDPADRELAMNYIKAERAARAAARNS